MALVRSIVFVDGENLTMRYQALAAAGRKPLPSVSHIQDICVWTSDFQSKRVIDTDVLRVNYYTSVVGDDGEVCRIKDSLANLPYLGIYDYYGRCQLYPRVYKKPKKSNKSRLVDINITIDVMRHCYSNAIDVVYIFSGDGDFVNLVEEVARSGKKVCVAAFSSGLERRLVTSVDRFVLSDDFYFEPVVLAPSPSIQQIPNPVS